MRRLTVIHDDVLISLGIDVHLPNSLRIQLLDLRPEQRVFLRAFDALLSNPGFGVIAPLDILEWIEIR